MSARRRARAVRARVSAPPSFDWRHPRYGITAWPPRPGRPVTLVRIIAARRAARAARAAWEREHAPPDPPP
ncbi:hypothetical protein LHJ74_20395 [Streptomyces sp. N2-109]|uniref:Uncharacterized protein n=1 Tax=Streptomyces gossypii TaxID=2883101 RepID=A0ABT2JX31_9ACTN|nr:hypothetical protein [Streptomyces gossypii]MCT2592233.1 hypothetical protein [Streptomyces gossypii]